MNDEFRIYRGWFYAAAIYNGVWGIAVVLFLDRVGRENARPTGVCLQRVGRHAWWPVFWRFALTQARDPST
jgi:hypothetical protein